MYLELPTNDKEIFEQYLTFMNPFFNLTPNEIKVLAALLFLYKESQGGKESFRWGYVFSTEGKNRVKEFTGMNTNQVNLTISSMSKKQIMGDDIIIKEPHKHINPKCVMDPIANPVIQITFKIDGQETKKESAPVQVIPETRGDNPRDRDEVWNGSDDSYPDMVSTIPQLEEKDQYQPTKGRDDGYISPGKFSAGDAIPVRKVYTEPEESRSS